MRKEELQMVDITDSINGKLEEGNMNLYLYKEKIGRILMSGQENRYEMSEGFKYHNGKIYRMHKITDIKQYVTDCDLGWC
ncbi:YusG family protein [Halobacillus sp. MO56]